MRVHLFILSLLCTPLGIVQTLAATWTAHNNTSTNVYIKVTDAGGTPYLNYTLVPANNSINFDLYSGTGLTGKAYNNGSGSIYYGDFTPTPFNYNSSPTHLDWNGGAVAHNYCCVYCINWTNTGTTYATPTLFAVDGSNNVTELGFNLSVVAPGYGISRCYTNCYGANPPPGGCGYAIFGDTRPNKTVPDVTVNGTQYDYPSNPGSGSGGTGGQGPIIDPGNTNSPASGALTNTNLATGGDINRLGDSLIKAIAKLEITTDRINTNLGALNRDLNSDFTNLRTNLVDAIHGITNAFGDQSALTNLAAIRSSLTNLYGIATNIGSLVTNEAAVAGILNGITNGVIWGLSNALYMTNLPLAGYLAQWFTNFSTNFDKIEQLRAGYADTASGLNAIGSGTAPAADWGVIPLHDMWGNPLFGSLAPGIDLKPAINLQRIEDYSPGFRTWFRLIVLWFTTALAIFWIAAELRLALFQSLAIPPLPGAGDTKLLMGIGAVAGPVGAGAGATAGLTLKITSAIILITSLIFLPAILVNLATTVESLWPSLADLLSANSTVTVLPGDANKAIYLISQWFPLIPLCVLGVNFLIAKLGLDNTVSFMMLYIKVTQE